VSKSFVPKQKTHKGAASRMRLTGKGKVRRSKAGKSHLNSAMSPRRTRKARGTTIMKGGRQHRESLRLLAAGRR
jgi:large subunit ribosomal protein L35